MENILIACEYKELNANTPVFNLSSLQNYFWVQVPKKLCKYKLYEMYDLSHPIIKEVNFYGKIIQDVDHPWIKIPLEILDMKSGKHTYKLCFLDTQNENSANTFISYISQDDNPETPYVYMQGRGNPLHDANKWKDGMYSDEYLKELQETIIENYGYDPFAYSGYTQSDYCAMCTTYNCDNCPYGIRR